MKRIKYHLSTRVNRGSESAPCWEEVLTPVEMDWCEENEGIARKEAAEGRYTVEDDGKSDGDEPTQEERIRSLEETLALLLKIVTEGSKS